MMNIMKKSVLVGTSSTVLVSILLSACATIFSGTKEDISIDSDPPKAKIYVNDEYIGEAPVRTTFSKDKGYLVTAKKEGYTDSTAGVSKRINNLMWLNLLGGMLCWGIDYLTGAMWTFEKDHVMVKLERKGASAFHAPGQVVAGEGLKVVMHEGKTYVVEPRAADSSSQ